MRKPTEGSTTRFNSVARMFGFLKDLANSN